MLNFDPLARAGGFSRMPLMRPIHTNRKQHEHFWWPTTCACNSLRLLSQALWIIEMLQMGLCMFGFCPSVLLSIPQKWIRYRIASEKSYLLEKKSQIRSSVITTSGCNKGRYAKVSTLMHYASLLCAATVLWLWRTGFRVPVLRRHFEHCVLYMGGL